MTRKIFVPALLLLVFSPLAKSAIPELIFPSGISWKAIFDSGLRPKHISGLERKEAECRDQELVFRFKDSPPFHLDSGRLMANSPPIYNWFKTGWISAAADG